MRPTKLQTFMKIAEAVSERSHDSQTHVGGVLVDPEDDTIVATGYNGFASGVHDELLPTERPDKYQYVIHSEQNILTYCARKGIKAKNCYLVCTHTPCDTCLLLLWQAGIRKIVAKTQYTNYDTLFTRQDIQVKRFDTKEGYIGLQLEKRSSFRD